MEVEYSFGAPGMPRRALRHEDIRLTYAARWKVNPLGEGAARRQGEREASVEGDSIT